MLRGSTAQTRLRPFGFWYENGGPRLTRHSQPRAIAACRRHACTAVLDVRVEQLSLYACLSTELDHKIHTIRSEDSSCESNNCSKE
jgi:hypothetical protein